MSNQPSGYWDTETEIVVVQGASYQQFWVLESDTGYVDTTGMDAQMQVRLTPDSTTAIATYTTTNGKLLTGQTVGPYTGCLLLNLSPADTAPNNLPGGLRARYDLLLIDGAKVIPFAAQTFCVQDAVTEVS